MDNSLEQRRGENPLQFIREIDALNQRCQGTDDQIKKLIKDLEEADQPLLDIISHCDDKYKIFGRELPITKIDNGISHKDILDLIVNIESGDHKKIGIISELISSNNECTKLIANLIANLAMLSGMTYQNISQIVHSLNDIDLIVNENIKDTDQVSMQLKKIVVAQLQKLFLEKEQFNKFMLHIEEVKSNAEIHYLNLSSKLQEHLGVINDLRGQMDLHKSAIDVISEKMEDIEAEAGLEQVNKQEVHSSIPLIWKIGIISIGVVSVISLLCSFYM